MQLPQEIGNKQHVYFEHQIATNTDFKQSILCVSSFYDSVLLSIHDSNYGNILGVRLCNKLDFKADSWFDFDFLKICYYPADVNFDIVPIDFTDLKLPFIKSINAESHKPLFSKFVSNYKKSINSENYFYIEKWGNDYLFFLVISDKIVLSNQFMITSLDELVYHILNILELNNLKLEECDFYFHYNILEIQEVVSKLATYGIHVDFLKSQNINFKSDYPMIFERLFVNYNFVQCLF
ncbi:MAG: hypothetical protein Q8K70_12775 [Bacteroidota bacterium]|nr:hypothetical protein [Bacteroidota bacterium]